MKQLAKKIIRHYSVLVFFHAMLFSLLSSCDHQSLEPAQTTQLQLTQATQFEDSLEGLVQAIRANNLPEVKRLIKAGISLSWHLTRYHRESTALHLASEIGRLAIVQYFITELNLDPNITNIYSKTPLHLTIGYGHRDVFNFLIQAGANPRAQTSVGDQPIHSAVLGNHLGFVRYLIEEAQVDPKAIGDKERQPIQIAAECGYSNIIDYLVKEAKVDPKVKTSQGDMLIHLAASSNMSCYSDVCARNNLATIYYLINQFQADPEARNNAGQSPLHLAAKKGRLLMVKHLVDDIRVNAEPIDHQGKTPLHLAAEGNHIETVKYLIEEAKVNPKPMDNQFQTPLDLARTNKCQEVVEYLAKPLSISWAVVN
jgi:ankyrin repeat protein